MQITVASVAVTADMHPGEYHFLHALLLQLVDFVHYRGDRAAALLAAGDGDHAEAALVAAAVLHLDKGPLPAACEQAVLPRPGGELGHHGETQFAFGYLHQTVFVQVVYHQVGTQGLCRLLRIEGGETAADHQFGLGVAPLGPMHQLAGLAHGLGGDRAGVQHHQVSLRQVLGELVALCLKIPRPALQLGLVEPAAKGLQMNAHFFGAVSGGAGAPVYGNWRWCFNVLPTGLTY